MDRIFDWIKSFIYFGLFLTILMQLLPDVKYKKYVRFFAGMIFIVLVMGPVFRIFSDDNILDTAVEKLEYQQEQETVRMDFSYMEQEQQEYYRQKVLASAEEIIEQEAAGQGFSVVDSQIGQNEETNEVRNVTVTVQNAENEEKTQEDQKDITAVEAIRIQISGENGEQKNEATPLVSAKAVKLQEEIADLFGIPEKQVKILEE